MRTFLIPGIIGALIVAMGSFLARSFGWYNDYWFTDIILHTISGLWLGLFFLAFTQEPSKLLRSVGTVSFAVFGSVLWEYWEYAGYLLTRSKVPFYIPQLSDTLGDITCGMVGGIFLAIIVTIFTKQKTA